MDQSCINLAAMSDPAALPRYVQIAEMLIREIASGRLGRWRAAAARAVMAAELGIAVGTLRHALARPRGARA